jgi:hypothetical protein
VKPLINRPSTAFQVDDIQREFTTLKERGVRALRSRRRWARIVGIARWPVL